MQKTDTLVKSEGSKKKDEDLAWIKRDSKKEVTYFRLRHQKGFLLEVIHSSRSHTLGIFMAYNAHNGCVEAIQQNNLPTPCKYHKEHQNSCMCSNS